VRIGRPLLSLAVTALVAAAPGAPAAEDRTPEAHDAVPGVPAIPRGDATIRGRVVHPEGGQRARDLEVVLYALGPEGPGLERTRTGPDGSFAFSGISGDPRIAYLLGARYRGMPFPGARLSFRSGERERVVEIPIAEPIPDVSRLSVDESRMRIEWVAGRLLVTEHHRIRNPNPAPVYVPADLRADHPAAFLAELLPGARDFSMPMGVVPEGIAREGRKLRFYGPVYPGVHDLSFSYAIPPAPGGLSLEKSFAVPTPRFSLWIPEGGPEVESAALSGPEEETLEEQRYRVFRAEGLGAGAELAFRVRLPDIAHDPDLLALREQRLFLEYDGAALLVRELYSLEVAGRGHLAGTAEAPLLRIELPEDARDLRLGEGAAAVGLSAAGDGGLAVAGPLPPGPSTIEIGYRIPAAGGPISLSRPVPAPLPLFTAFIADTGLAVETDRLHRRRPVRTPDRTYMHLEAFELEPGERVNLVLRPLPARRGLSGPRGLAAALVLALPVAFFLAGPLLGSRAQTIAAEPAEPAARREREALLASIRDLDEDHETGKISDDDWRSMRAELRARAARLLEEERLAQEPVPAPEPAALPCPRCAHEPGPEDRFCSRCGAALAHPGSRAATA